MRVSWVLLGFLGMLTVSWGFALDRSIPVGWGKLGPFEKILNGKIQVTGMEKILPASEAKKSIKPEDEIISDQFREKRSELLAFENPTNRTAKGLEELKDDMLLSVEENSSIFPKESEVEKPRNVVLLFIDESGQDSQEIWKSLKTSNNFSVHGFLQTCRNEGNLLRFSLNETFVSGPNYHCQCENFLRANVASLLSWAHRAKEMSTGAVSATNFSIPSGLEYESLIFRRNSEDSDENKMKIFKPQLHDEWHLIDVDKERMSSVSHEVSSTPKQEREGMWDVFDTFSKIRIAFFRNWLESFLKNIRNTEEEFPARKSIPLEFNLVELMRDTVEKLKSSSNDKGFIMVAVAPGNTISPAIGILETEISPKDTLLVVSGICSEDRKLVPFFANGPGSKYLSEAKTIWDLTYSVRKAVSSCQGIWCKAESLNPIWASDNEFHRRFAREEANDEKLSSTSVPASITEKTKAPDVAKVSAKNLVADHSKHDKSETLPKISTEETTEKLNEKYTALSSEKLTTKSNEKSTAKLDETTKQESFKKTSKQSNENDKENSTGKSSETTSEKPLTESHNLNGTSEFENATNVKLEQNSLPKNSGASVFSMETTAIIGAVTSFVAIIFLDF